jgi:hypothetical protein
MTKTLIAAAATAAALSASAEAAIVDLGTFSNVGRLPTTITGNLGAEDLLFVTFTLPFDVTSSNGGFLDITTNDTFFLPNGIEDTEIALYSGSIFDPANTTLVASDDIDGLFLQSTLSFGAGSGTLPDDGGSIADPGEDGDLLAGDYILVFGEFNVTTGSTVDAVSASASSVGGDYEIDFIVGIPEPTTAALAGLGGLTMLRRRR